MAISHFMIEESVEHDRENYLLMGRVEVLEDQPGFRVHYSISTQNRMELDLEIRFSISNPIGIDDIIVGTATVYGFCIAGKLTRKTAKEAIKCYRKSKKDDPNRGLLEHAKAAGACVAGKGSAMKDTVTDALVDCMKLPKDDDDDDSDD